MKILLLSPYPEKILPVLEKPGDEITVTPEKITPALIRSEGFEIGVSFGYRHILKPDVLALCPFVNLHISYLPWNRGADPNLWSWVDGTPKGVTVHFIDEGVDTGDIIMQRRVDMGNDETLSTSYEKLQAAMSALFAESWPSIRSGKAGRTPQDRNAGSLHRLADRKELEHLLTDGYDTKVSRLAPGKGKNSASV